MSITEYLADSFAALHEALAPAPVAVETDPTAFDAAAWTSFAAPTAATDSIRAKFRIVTEKTERRASGKTQEAGGLAGYTPRWNALAVEAIALGIPGVKLHKTETRPGEANTFATYAIARARVSWLEAKIAAARPAPVEASVVEAPVEAPAETKNERKARKARERRAIEDLLDAKSSSSK
jgi:hypothetical protein